MVTLLLNSDWTKDLHRSEVRLSLIVRGAVIQNTILLLLPINLPYFYTSIQLLAQHYYCKHIVTDMDCVTFAAFLDA